MKRNESGSGTYTVNVQKHAWKTYILEKKLKLELFSLDPDPESGSIWRIFGSWIRIILCSSYGSASLMHNVQFQQIFGLLGQNQLNGWICEKKHAIHSL